MKVGYSQEGKEERGDVHRSPQDEVWWISQVEPINKEEKTAEVAATTETKILFSVNVKHGGKDDKFYETFKGANINVQKECLHSSQKIVMLPSGQPVTKMEFEFEQRRRRITMKDVRELIYREILEYHPSMVKELIDGAEPTGFMYPRSEAKYSSLSNWNRGLHSS
ncbi:hypothetical protein Tco_1228045 [Tanacetum coccineum]